MQRKIQCFLSLVCALLVFCAAACMANGTTYPDIIPDQIAPESKPQTKLPLKGIMVAINAGHTTATNPRVPYNGDGVGTHSGADTIVLRYPGNNLAIRGGRWNGVIRESDLTQDLAERIARRLENLGARTIQTRVHSTETTFRGRQKNLEARVEKANKAKADILLDLHANYGFRDERGFMLFIPASQKQSTLFRPGVSFARLNEKIHTPFRDVRLQKSLAFAKCLYSALTDANPIPPFWEGLYLSRFYVITHVNMPAVLIECGFMNIPTDMRLLAEPSYRNDFAVWIGNAVCAYFGR
ncbi:MAG: N-acetylmuramoyl-L-alanine amidase [Spirochaetota bacterium]|nr:N-acetylmuramoyl-L-alanine amidase [Spirochaetota bacterium]